MRLFASILFACLIHTALWAQTDTVTVDPSKILRDTSRHPIGINTNYLMDDDSNRSAPRTVAAALKEMGVKFLRYPGGEKSDANLWSHPPFEESIPTLARTGPNEWPSGDRNLVQNDGRTWKIDPLDFDEFIAICREVGAEPVIVICFDSMYKPATNGGTAPTRDQLLQTAIEWVRYTNITKHYGVKYWEMGNESDQNHYNGGTTAENYATDFIAFASAMKGVDPTIQIGANGRPTTWWQTVLGAAYAHMDFLVVHEYPCWQWGSYDYYRTRTPNLLQEVTRAVAAINNYVPESDRSRLTIAATEMGPFDWSTGGWPRVNDLGHALVLCEMTGELLKHPRVEFAQFWNTRWVETTSPPGVGDALDPNNRFNPTGRALAIWGQFLREKMVSATSTAMVRVFATASASGELNVVLVNKDTSARSTRVTFSNYAPRLQAARWVFRGTGPDDTAPTWLQETSVGVTSGAVTLTLDPVSITVLSLQARPSHRHRRRLQRIG